MTTLPTFGFLTELVDIHFPGGGILAVSVQYSADAFNVEQFYLRDPPPLEYVDLMTAFNGPQDPFLDVQPKILFDANDPHFPISYGKPSSQPLLKPPPPLVYPGSFVGAGKPPKIEYPWSSDMLGRLIEWTDPANVNSDGGGSQLLNPTFGYGVLFYNLGLIKQLFPKASKFLFNVATLAHNNQTQPAPVDMVYFIWTGEFGASMSTGSWSDPSSNLAGSYSGPDPVTDPYISGQYGSRSLFPPVNQAAAEAEGLVPRGQGMPYPTMAEATAAATILWDSPFVGVINPTITGYQPASPPVPPSYASWKITAQTFKSSVGLSVKGGVLTPEAPDRFTPPQKPVSTVSLANVGFPDVAHNNIFIVTFNSLHLQAAQTQATVPGGNPVTNP